MSYENVKNSRDQRKLDMVYVMGEKCQLCGYHKDIHALKFHHLNPEEKELSFNKANSCSWERVCNELKKSILLCANCHREVHSNLEDFDLESSYDDKKAQEITNRITQLRQHQVKYCPNCGKIITSKATYCQDCAMIQKRVAERPDRDTLKNLIRTTSFLQIGKKYNVSDNAVRKWCIAYNLPSKVSIIKTISDEDWLQI